MVVFDDGGGNDVYEAQRDISEYEAYTDPTTISGDWTNLGGATAISTKGSLCYLKCEGDKTFDSDDACTVTYLP